MGIFIIIVLDLVCMVSEVDKMYGLWYKEWKEWMNDFEFFISWLVFLGKGVLFRCLLLCFGVWFEWVLLVLYCIILEL